MPDDASLPVVRRRRWPRIVALLFLIAIVGGFVFWLVKPQTASATALFEVRREVPSVTGDQPGQSNSDGNYEILKKTQVALLKSRFVLTSALRDPSIGASPLFWGVADHEAWLQDHLEVGYPQNGEILEIKLRGPKSQRPDLIVMVDAIAEAYKREVLGSETDRKLKQHDMLERSLQSLNAEIKRKFEDYIDIAKGMGRADGDIDPEMQIDMKRVERVDEELAQLEREQLRISTGGDSKDSKFVGARIEQLLKRQNELIRTIQKRSEKSVDLSTRKSELDQLQRIANDLSLKLETMDIDMQSPSRIRQVQPAVIDDGKIARQ
jgi:succinoglycan biosynthesis transport protein ExoP